MSTNPADQAMTDDEAVTNALPAAAALVCAVTDYDKAGVADVLTRLDRDELYALAVVLAAHVPDDTPLTLGGRAVLSVDGICRNIVDDVSRRFDVPVDRIMSTDRHREVLDARTVAMAACRLARLSSTAIGGFFGRDHSTVLYAATRAGEDTRLRKIARAVAAPYIHASIVDDDDHESAGAA